MIRTDAWNERTFGADICKNWRQEGEIVVGDEVEDVFARHVVERERGRREIQRKG